MTGLRREELPTLGYIKEEPADAYRGNEPRLLDVEHGLHAHGWASKMQFCTTMGPITVSTYSTAPFPTMITRTSTSRYRNTGKLRGTSASITDLSQLNEASEHPRPNIRTRGLFNGKCIITQVPRVVWMMPDRFKWNWKGYVLSI